MDRQTLQQMGINPNSRGAQALRGGSINMLAKLYRKALPKTSRTVQSGIGQTKRRGNSLAVANVNMQVHQRNVQRMKFGVAPVHEDHPEGGLRLVGELPNVSSDSLGVCSNGFATSAAFYPGAPAAAGNFQYIAVSPTAYDNNVVSTRGLFASANSSHPVNLISKYFRYFRFRKLSLLYEGSAPTSQSGSVQFSYDVDVNALESNMTAGTTTQVQASTNVTERFPWWTAQAEVKLIVPRQPTKSDKLYRCSSTGATVTTGSQSNADCELYFQGAIAGIGDVSQTASVQILGRYRWIFVLDLYEFCVTTGDGSITLNGPSLKRCPTCKHEEPLSPEERMKLGLDKRRSRGVLDWVTLEELKTEQKCSDEKKSDTSLCDLSARRETLTPKQSSRYVFVDEPEVRSTKSQSLKGVSRASS